MYNLFQTHHKFVQLVIKVGFRNIRGANTRKELRLKISFVIRDSMHLYSARLGAVKISLLVLN